MVTIITQKVQVINPDSDVQVNEIHDVRLLSTDTKPIDVANGSTCLEIDTGDMYVFDAEGGSWNVI